MHADHPNRKPTRMRGFDYSRNRAYFITVCTQERKALLADICRGGALLLPIGELVEQQLLDLPAKYDVVIDKYVIMPNHIHMILVLCSGRDGEEQSPSPTLSDVVCLFKSITTKQANRMDGNPGRRIWQRSFHDHIIRNEQDYEMIWRYIDENPQRWEQDCFFQNSERETSKP